ncbi:hypothetical protein [Streptomyces marispadix]|uniref:Uncharacterized protein n=1 Tax=Streptomyces marispadix TaxID=2922868 RepID=A0ABS9T3B9_9ACTN|nr:hypothetical protein [Streptomyces marispadix]MCH6162756.1 hypothetical protein [Streptomyces marispadix]
MSTMPSTAQRITAKTQPTRAATMDGSSEKPGSAYCCEDSEWSPACQITGSRHARVSTAVTAVRPPAVQAPVNAAKTAASWRSPRPTSSGVVAGMCARWSALPPRANAPVHTLQVVSGSSSRKSRSTQIHVCSAKRRQKIPPVIRAPLPSTCTCGIATPP